VNVLVDMGGISFSRTWTTIFFRVTAGSATLSLTGQLLSRGVASALGSSPCRGWRCAAEAVLTLRGIVEDVRGVVKVLGSSPSAPVDEAGMVFFGPDFGSSGRRMKPCCSAFEAVVMGSTRSAGQACKRFSRFYFYAQGTQKNRNGSNI
jgi:hypothetical protein